MNATPDAGWKRWIIDFHDWPLEKAQQYPACLAVVEEKVKPQRMESNRERYRRYWWQFGERQQGLYDRASPLNSVIVIAYTSNTLAFSIGPAKGMVFYNSTVVCSDQDAYFAQLQSSLHLEWIREFGSTLKGDARYAPERCFEPYPFSFGRGTSQLDQRGRRYFAFRRNLMLNHKEGLTKTYNRFHDPDETSADIQKLRQLHVEMDNAVVAAYGWTDLDLGHDFHETKQGLRYTISEPARREVLARLLKLNHERYAEEVRQGLHEKKGKGKKAAPKKQAASKAAKEGSTLFDGEEDE